MHDSVSICPIIAISVTRHLDQLSQGNHSLGLAVSMQSDRLPCEGAVGAAAGVRGLGARPAQGKGRAGVTSNMYPPDKTYPPVTIISIILTPPPRYLLSR